MTRLLAVEPDADRIVLAFGANRAANSRLLAMRQVEFHASTGDGQHVVFSATRPSEIEHAGAMAIRFDFPAGVIKLQRRAHVRVPLTGKFTLRCIADTGGVTPFEARVVDVSRGGIGAILYSADIHLEPGTRLPRCLIVPPRGDAVPFDIEVRHTRRLTLRDGRAANRSGCRFAGPEPDVEALQRLFMVELRGDAT